MFYIKPMVHPLPFCGKRFFPVHLAPVSDNKGAVIYCGEVCVWEGGGVATEWEGVSSEVLNTCKKGVGAESVLAMLKEGGGGTKRDLRCFKF